MIEEEKMESAETGEGGSPAPPEADVSAESATEKERPVEKKASPPPKKEKPEKCEQCGKALSRVKWYYRNNGYYCNKSCWKEFSKSREAEPEA